MTQMFPTPTADTNVIRYRIFFRAPQPPSPTETPSPALPLNVEADRAFAESRRDLYAAFVADKVGDFIWHKHALHLRVTPTPFSHTLLRALCLEGETSVGDAIDDEWVVTWLLFQLTTEFPHDDALVQVSDTDGEFLLIECADVLPDWVSPENSTNRVFLKQGVLHLVSVDVVPESSHPYKIEELPTAVGKHHTKTRTKQQEIHAQQVFSESIRAVVDEHVGTRANAAMQRMLQQKLHEAPRYMRSNRHRVRCQVPPKVAWVLAARPTIVGAAVEAFYYREPREATAICNQMKVFSPVNCVTTIVTMSRCQYAQLKQQRFFPPKPFLHLHGIEEMKADDDTRNMSPVARAAEVGVKLACGLELLYAADECDQFGTPWRQIIDETVSTLDASGAGINSADDNEEDDDAWLYVHPDSLEERLRSVAMRTATDGEEEVDGETVVGGAEELQNIATMFTTFMGGISGVDGVESSEPVQFDMGAFMQLLNGERTSGPMVEDDDEWDDPDDDEEEEEDGEVSSIDSDDELDHEPEEEDDRIMREAMAEMDAELAGSTLDKTFTRVTEVDTGASNLKRERHTLTNSSIDLSHSSERSTDEENLEDKPLDLDFNLLSNLLESMASQEGLAGPVSNILSELSATPSSRQKK